MNKYDKFLFDTHKGCFQEIVHEEQIFRTFPDEVDQRKVIGKARRHGVKIIRRHRDNTELAQEYYRQRELIQEMTKR